jgi:hypothetical protein
MARTKVFVVGSFTEGLTRSEKDFRIAGTALGKALSDASCDIVLCSDRESTADRWVFEGYQSGSDPRAVTVFALSRGIQETA